MKIDKLENQDKIIVSPSFAEIFDMIKEHMIETGTTKAQYTGNGEFVFFNTDKKEQK